MRRKPENQTDETATIPELALRFRRSENTIRSILKANQVEPSLERVEPTGRPRRLFDVSTVEPILSRGHKPLTELEAAMLQARVEKLRMENDIRAHALLSVDRIRSITRQLGTALRSWLAQHLIAEGPSMLTGMPVATARAYGEQAMRRIAQYFEGELLPWRDGPDRLPDLDLRSIVAGPATTPEVVHPKDQLQRERLRKLRDANSSTARGLTPRVSYLLNSRKVADASLQALRPLLLKKYPTAIVALNVPDGRAYSRDVFDQVLNTLQTVAVKVWRL